MTQKQRLRPMRDYVLLRRLVREETESGLVIPEIAQDDNVRAEVVAAGPGCWQSGKFVETTIRPGDLVYGDFMATAVPVVEVNGERLALVHESQIVGKWVDELGN